MPTPRSLPTWLTWWQLAGYLRRDHQAPALLIGHSLGGAAVLAAAAASPEVRAVATIGDTSQGEPHESQGRWLRHSIGGDGAGHKLYLPASAIWQRRHERSRVDDGVRSTGVGERSKRAHCELKEDRMNGVHHVEAVICVTLKAGRGE